MCIDLWAKRLSVLVAWLVLGVALALPSRAYADTIVLFNTGVDAAGAPLADGAVDPHYTLTSSADVLAPGPNAIVVTSTGFPFPAWTANTASSKWISIRADGNVSAAAGNYVFRISFTLANVDPATATISGKWAADNSVSLTLNGVPTGQSYGSLAALGSFTIPAGSNFVLGTNTLDFVVNNLPSGAPTGNPTGVQVSALTGFAECTSDANCSAGQWCNDVGTPGHGSCQAKTVNGVTVPGGSCPGVAARACASAVCDTADTACGIANFDGPCDASTAAVVCRSGVCSAALVCMPAGACAADADCASTSFCDTGAHACTPKLANGAAIPTIAGHTPALTGACTAQVGAAVCATGICDADNQCGLAVGDGTCASTAQCRSGQCITSGANSGKCEPCALDGQCAGATPACNTTTNQCVQCTSSSSSACTGTTPLCNAATSACTGCTGNNGSAASFPCPSASPFCNTTTGACSAGCLRDSDCGAGNWCNAGACVAQLANGTSIPSVAGHTPALSGTCTAAAGAAVCASGACDTADNKCGFATGDGTCASTAQCRSGVCVTGGGNNGKCEPCTSDGNCAGATPACNTATNQCVACTSTNTAACTGTSPVCNTTTQACVACTVDNGVPGTSPCPTTASPFCGGDGSCGLCTSNGQCTGAAHAGAVCNPGSGACGAQCTVDADCPGKWCNNPTAATGAGTCAAKIANGQPIPTSAPLGGVCTGAIGTRVCASGVCDTGDNLCGEPNARPCTGSAMCRSNVCNADGACGDPNGAACSAATTCRSGVCDSDGKCGERNGEACSGASACRSSICIAADATCGSLNGAPCTAAAECRAGACFSDNRCGLPNGQACTTGSACRSGACVSGTCAAACTTDAQCTGSYCNGGACLPLLTNGAACARATQCASNVCNADGKCGDPNGAACTSPTTCRAGACSSAVCGATCAADGDCGANAYCSSGACATTGANGGVCTRARQCNSGVCGSDNACGAPNNAPCSSAAQCRSGVCDATGTCKAQCVKDADCNASAFCDTSAHACRPAGANGEKPGGSACTRGTQCVSGVCDADGSCGELFGETCGSPSLCRAAVCDPNDTKCGVANGDGPCTALNGTTVCRSAICDNGKCGYANGDGPCSSNGQCASNKCDTSAQKCVACVADGDCPSGQFCDGTSQTCAPTLGDGSACTRAAQCASGFCGDDVCGGTKEPDAGAPDAGADATTQGDAGTDAGASHDASSSDAQPVTDGSAADAGDVGVQGGGCTCTSAPGHEDGSLLALGGLGSLALALFARARRRAPRAP